MPTEANIAIATASTNTSYPILAPKINGLQLDSKPHEAASRKPPLEAADWPARKRAKTLPPAFN